MIVICDIFRFFRLFEVDKKDFIKKHILYLLVNLISAICSIVYPLFVHLIIDNGLKSGNSKKIVGYCCLMAIIGLVMVISGYFTNLIYYKFNITFNMFLKNKLFFKIVNSKYDTSSQKKVGNLCTCLNSDVGRVSEVLTCEIPYIIKSLFTFIGVSGFVVFYFRIAGIVIILFSLLTVLFQRKMGNRIVDLSENVREFVGREASYATEVFSNLQNIQMSGYISLVNKEYKVNNEKVRDSAIKNNAIVYLSGALGHLINMTILLLIITMGAIGIYRELMDVGILFTMTIYAQRLVGPIAMMISSYIEVKNVSPSFFRILNLVDEATSLNKGTLEVKNALKTITYKNIVFGYPEVKRKLFDNFSFEICEGDIVGVVGNNGIGKSSIIKFLFQLIMPEQGEIIVNNVYNLKDINIKFLYNNLGYVGQFPFHFSGKLRDVVNPLKKKIEDEKIKEIFRKVNLDIGLFDGTLDFELSENSINISGGEKQKLALVRLIIENKSWFILDEPTSAMDSESEKIVCNYLREVCLNKTALIITHRTEILGICNKVINLNNLLNIS